MKPLHSFGIVAFKSNDRIRDLIRSITVWAQRESAPVRFHPVMTSLLPSPEYAASSECDLIDASDAVISLGGDGTFLSTVHMCRFSAKPVLGVNTGGLGFLTDIGPENLDANLARLRTGDYRLIHRMVLQAELRRAEMPEQKLYALNDIFINRYDMPKIISVAAWYGDDFITEFQGDGVLVATPSGSTAYSLAAGGPIVEPEVEAFLITPLCPHSLTERPMILPSRRPLRLLIGAEPSAVTLSADGLDSIRLHGGDEIVISHAPLTTNLIRLSNMPYFEILRTKLDWGRAYKKRGG